MSESLERLVRNQSLFERGERAYRVPRRGQRAIAPPPKAPGASSRASAVTRCISTIELTVVEYERVRSNPTWFVIKPDHDLAQIERVVSEATGSRLSRS